MQNIQKEYKFISQDGVPTLAHGRFVKSVQEAMGQGWSITPGTLVVVPYMDSTSSYDDNDKLQSWMLSYVQMERPLQ